MTRLEQLVKELPPELHRAAEDFLESLLAKQSRKRKGALKLDWRGGLRDSAGPVYFRGASAQGSGMVGRLVYLLDTKSSWNFYLINTTPI